MSSLRILIALCLFTSVGFASIEPARNLRVDYNTRPLGLDNERPSFSWVVGDRSRGAMQSAYQVVVGESAEAVAEGKGDVWDSGRVSSDASFQVVFEGKELRSSTRYFWSVRTWDADGVASRFTEPEWFETGLLDASDWEGYWIGDGTVPPSNPEAFYERLPAPLLRKDFEADKEIAQARLYVSGLGYYEAYLNGEKVGDHVLDPGWTQYADTVYYSTYDVTQQLQSGDNAIGVMLGNGWYNPLPMDLFGRWNLREILTIGQPKALVQLRIEYTNGDVELVVSDDSWKTSEGPIVRNNVYLGEWYDARLEQEGWSKAGFNDRKWKRSVRANAPGGELKWQFIDPIRHTRTVYPISMHKSPEGNYVFDLGQNFAGVIRFRSQAPNGTELVFRYAELVYPDGTLDFRTTAATQIKEGGISGGPGAPATAWQEDRYFAKGAKGGEVFEPRFTFHGFRYVEVAGLPYEPTLNDIEGLRWNSDLSDAASFSCSDELFNRVQEISEWTFLSNVFSVESDCPAREKFGYGGDIVTAGEAYIRNYGMENFYVKTIRDFARDARENGAMPECAPDIGINLRGVVEDTGPVGWTLAHPFALEQLYDYYGRKDILEEQYQPLKDLVEFYRRNVPEHIIEVGIGDHVSVDERPTPVTSTAFYYDHARILAKIAGILGKAGDEKTYLALADDIKAAFIEEFVNVDTGEVYTRTQAAQIFALYYDLLPEGVQSKALDVLLEEIYRDWKGHLSTGIFSTKMLLEYLNENNLNKVAYDILSKKEYPGYGYMIDNDATTLWENWHFATGDSKNHPMFGSVTEWFSEAVLGIRQAEDSVGFKNIVIRPALVGGLYWADGYYDSVRGKIRSKWWISGDDLFFEVEIPANTEASVHLPMGRRQPHSKPRPDIYEGDTLIVDGGTTVEGAHPDIKSVRSTREDYVLEIGSGTYRFKVR